MGENEKFVKYVKSIIYKVLNKEKLLKGEWNLGKVESVIDAKHLKVFVNGSSISQTIPCNPDVTFAIGDEVWVIFPNHDERNAFVISKRAV